MISNQRDLGDYLKELRKKKKLSIRQLEELSGVSNSFISQLEKGERRPSIITLNKLATALDIPQDELWEKAGYYTKEEIKLRRELEEIEIRKELEQLDELELKNKLKKIFGVKEGEHESIDLLFILNNKNITYNETPLSDKDIERIKSYLEIKYGEKED